MNSDLVAAQELIAAVALALGHVIPVDHDWRVTVNGPDVAMLTDGTRELSVRLTGDRLTVRGHFPFRRQPGGGSAAPDLPHGATVPSITVSAAKAPGTIAREIRRRMWDDYEALRVLVAERHASANAHEQATADTYARLAAETGAVVGDNGRKYLRWPSGSGTGYIWNEQIDGGKVSLDLRSLPVDVAIKVINLVHGRA
jgi:hypothetical protein